MIWKIEGTEAETGKDCSIVVEAGDEKDALHIAKGRGIFASDVKLLRKEAPPVAEPIRPVENTPVKNESSNHDAISLLLGTVGLFAWLLPIVGFPVCVAGLIYGIKAKHGLPGILLNLVGLMLSIINSVSGAVMGYNGQLFH